jgi:hypothetical protein
MYNAYAISLFGMENLLSLLFENKRADFSIFFRFVHGINRSQMHI